MSCLKDLTHDFVGEYHTKAFDKLAEKYASKKPTSKQEIVEDMLEAFDSLCDEGTCAEYDPNQLRNEFFRTSKHGKHELHLPKNIHPKLSESVTNVEEVIGRLDEHNIEEVVDDLTAMKHEIEDFEGLDEGHKLSTLVGISVAIESSKLWHSVHFDEDHPLHFGAIESHGDRRLQANILSKLTGVVVTDMMGAFNFTFGAVGQDLNYLGLFPGLVLWSPAFAAMASAAAFAIDVVGLDEDKPIPLLSFFWSGFTLEFFTNTLVYFQQLPWCEFQFSPFPSCSNEDGEN